MECFARSYQLRVPILMIISPPLDPPSLSLPNDLTGRVLSIYRVGDVGACSFKIPPLFINSCFVISITNADLADHQFKGPTLSPSRVPLDAPAIPDLPLPANLPLLHKPRKKHLSPRGAPTIVVAPAHPPNHAPLITFGHPPTSSRLSKSSMKKNGLVSPSVGLVDVAPPQSGDGTNPTGLAQPPLSPSVSDCCKPDMVLKRGSHGCHCVYPIKLDLLLLNISQNPNWNMFLERIASQLGLQVSQIEIINFYVVSLSRLNISMDILPHTGISFSASDASAINSSLTLHKVHFDSTLVGGYKLLNLTWFEPPAPSPAPIVSSSPVKAPVYQSSTPSAVGSSKKGKHTNLILILGIGAGIVIIAIVSILIICSCTFRKGKPKASSKETEPVNPGTKDPAPAAGSLPHPSSTRFLAYEELKEATNNFEPASILGEGGFGRVFKGVLSDGTAVAIKRLTNGGQQGDKEFLVEVEMLSRLHHRNLVKLVGYYSSRDSSQNLLCYELVPNGSLEAWLHGPLGPSGQENLVTWARPILRDKDRLEELVDPRLGGKYPKEDFVRVCTIAAACVAPEASQRPSMGEVVQSLKMVQRVMEYQDSMLASNARANLIQSSTTFESDGTSSMFSSGPCSGLSAFDNDNISRTAVFSEDLHEGR
ncbi:RECEPTOR-LIKE SERINE/THREONINE-PROTEIN KINASE ALE2 [Salix koriyanagi]|uniref:RECEPTOR-LIKE SERINE/THREONINE-PROTEIN KINASE ALE2 n=1 Tax=Salix koriyanagi TaxID=2511006 RepID=A0A9Q0Z6N9_9ROSI|nr:RECEPTOR-LIKE SERINE/THREONINE-PROTEIN KINASE ALE2 [Salix koriyanagi]